MFVQSHACEKQDRGSVRQVDSGLLNFHNITADELTFTLQGRLLAGDLTLSRQPDGEWILKVETDEPRDQRAFAD